MSFLKITDPKKRDLMIKEFLETKKNIQQSQLHERVGEREFQEDLGKFFKPVTTAQKSAAEEIKEGLKEELKPLKEIAPAIAAIPGPFHAPLPLTGPEEEDLNTDTLYLGPTAVKYLGKSDTDTLFGIHMKDGKFYMGNTPIKVEGDNIIVGDKEYEGTRGLWELIIEKKPDIKIYNDDDFMNYGKLLFNTKALYRNNDPKTNRPKASKSYKWTDIVKPIWEYKDNFEGSGLSKDPNELLEGLDLLMESKKAGNTGVGRELVSICDELKRQNVLNVKQHKKLLLNI